MRETYEALIAKFLSTCRSRSGHPESNVITGKASERFRVFSENIGASTKVSIDNNEATENHLNTKTIGINFLI